MSLVNVAVAAICRAIGESGTVTESLQPSVTYPAPLSGGAAYDITFTFDTSYYVGTFADGSYWVRPATPGGSVVITGISPAASTRNHETFFTHAASPTTSTISLTAHGIERAKVRFSSSGSLPTGLATATDYWVSNNTANTLNVFSDAGYTTPVNISSAGTGNHTLIFQVGINGWEVNPTLDYQTYDAALNQQTQGYDGISNARVFSAYSDRFQTPLSMTLTPSVDGGSDKVISVIKSAGYSGAQIPQQAFQAVLTVVDSPVVNSENKFRPAYFGTDKRMITTASVLTSLLGKYPYAALLAQKGSALTPFATHKTIFSNLRIQHLHNDGAYKMGGAYNFNDGSVVGNSYGNTVALQNLAVIGRMIADDFSIADANCKGALYGAIQAAIDTAGCAKAGIIWEANGGQHNGKKSLLLWAYALTGNSLFTDAITKHETQKTTYSGTTNGAYSGASGQKVISGFTSIASKDVYAGMTVTYTPGNGTGAIPAGTFVASVSGSNITLTKNITTSIAAGSTGSISFGVQFQEDGHTYLNGSNEPLFGMVAYSGTNEAAYWGILRSGAGSKDARDPYETIDGFVENHYWSTANYQMQVSQSYVYTKRLVDIYGLYNSWDSVNGSSSPLFQYAERWNTSGLKATPDTYATYYYDVTLDADAGWTVGDTLYKTSDTTKKYGKLALNKGSNVWRVNASTANDDINNAIGTFTIQNATSAPSAICTPTSLQGDPAGYYGTLYGNGVTDGVGRFDTTGLTLTAAALNNTGFKNDDLVAIQDWWATYNPYLLYYTARTGITVSTESICLAGARLNANGYVNAITGGSFKITSDSAGLTTVVDWTTTVSQAFSEGQYLWVKLTTGSSGLTDYSVSVTLNSTASGGTASSYTVTTADAFKMVDNAWVSVSSGGHVKGDLTWAATTGRQKMLLALKYKKDGSTGDGAWYDWYVDGNNYIQERNAYLRFLFANANVDIQTYTTPSAPFSEAILLLAIDLSVPGASAQAAIDAGGYKGYVYSGGTWTALANFGGASFPTSGAVTFAENLCKTFYLLSDSINTSIMNGGMKWMWQFVADGVHTTLPNISDANVRAAFLAMNSDGSAPLTAAGYSGVQPQIFVGSTVGASEWNGTMANRGEKAGNIVYQSTNGQNFTDV